MKTTNITIFECDTNWDQAIENFPGTTFFDTQKWLKTFEWKADSIHKLLIKKGKKNIAAISFAITKLENGVSQITIPHSASFGGLLFKKNISALLLIDVYSALLSHISKLTSSNFKITYVQRQEYITNHPQFSSEEFALLRCGFKQKDLLLEYYIDMENMSPPGQTMRNQLRKNDGKLLFTKATMDEFIKFRQMIIRQQNKMKTIPDKELLLSEEASSQSISIYKMVYEKKTVSMLLSDRLNSNIDVARSWYQDADYKYLNATGSIVWEWLMIAKSDGIRKACFGSSASLAHDITPGMLSFKERFRPCTGLRRIFTYDSETRS